MGRGQCHVILRGQRWPQGPWQRKADCPWWRDAVQAVFCVNSTYRFACQGESSWSFRGHRNYRNIFLFQSIAHRGRNLFKIECATSNLSKEVDCDQQSYTWILFSLIINYTRFPAVSAVCGGCMCVCVGWRLVIRMPFYLVNHCSLVLPDVLRLSLSKGQPYSQIGSFFFSTFSPRPPPLARAVAMAPMCPPPLSRKPCWNVAWVWLAALVPSALKGSLSLFPRPPISNWPRPPLHTAMAES